MIRPGMLADLVLVSRNPMDATPEELAGIETALTMIGGKVVLEAGL
jgi:predicted amidohydrolase YtcJ